ATIWATNWATNCLLKSIHESDVLDVLDYPVVAGVAFEWGQTSVATGTVGGWRQFQMPKWIVQWTS
ncbi:MAG: hypothetical protein ACI9G1_005948, partial [Pirellulaceae bacterium]